MASNLYRNGSTPTTGASSVLSTPPPIITESTLEVARQQKLTNIKLKTACLENEALIQDLHVSDWSEKQRTKLAAAHEKTHELLAAVEQNTKWCPTEAFTPAKFVRQYGLQLHPKELSRPEDGPKLDGLFTLRNMLLDIRQHPHKTRVVNFSAVIDNAIAKINKLDEDFRKTQLDSTELAEIPVQVVTAAHDIMAIQPATTDLHSHDEEINQLRGQLQKAKEIRDVALADGEMTVAEEQFYAMAHILERMMELIRDKFRVLAVTEEENRGFRHFLEGPKKCYQLSGPMKDRERLRRKKCENDMQALQEVVQKADLDDAEALKAHAQAVERSDKLLQDNESQQNDCWRRIQELERTLQKLGSERFEEIKRRIDENELEEKRKTDYQQLLDAAAQHRKLLELTLYNVDSMIRGIGLVEDMVAELGGAVKTRYNKCTVDAGDTRVGIHEEYLNAYTKLYRCIGGLIYKKEKKLEDLDRQIRAAHIQLEFSIETFDANAKKHSEQKRALYEERAHAEEEIQTLKDKLATAEELFTPTAEALREAGVAFDHPADVVEQRNLNRRTKMVEYRTHIHKYQEMKLEREKERIRVAKEAIAQSPQHTQPLLRGGAAGVADPYSPAPADYDHSLGLLPPPIGSPNAVTAAGTAAAAVPAAPPVSPYTGNPRRTLLPEMNGSAATAAGLHQSLQSTGQSPRRTSGGSGGSGSGGGSGAVYPAGRWRSDMMGQTIYYTFIDRRTVVLDFSAAGFLPSEASFELNLNASPATFDVNMQACHTAGGEYVPPQTQRMLFRWTGTHSFQLQMNDDSSQRPHSFNEGSTVLFNRE